ncbi:MAG: hypothetical protein ABSG35_23675 [Syntrophobacteraceae bacterium]|jgi:uncharacterized protein YegJ (DUF2314 family)
MVRSIFASLLIIVISSLSQAAWAGDSHERGEETGMSDYRGPQDTPREFGRNFIVKMRQPYVEEAKRTYPQAKARFQSGLPAGYRFLVTIDLQENNINENAFMDVRKISDGKVTAVLATELIRVKSYQFGKLYVFPESEVVDWTITSPDGKEEGNFVGKCMDEYYRTHP